ncbi:acyl-CoA thioesterase [bacterium]|nr:acyl-CoA thioesterase [bacterium]
MTPTNRALNHLTREQIYDFEVSFDFIDAGGVVYHPRYYILLERARYHFCQSLGLNLVEHFNNGFVFVIAELQGRYRLPLRVADPFGIFCKVDKVTSRSMKMRQYIVARDKIEEALLIQDDEVKLAKISHFSGQLHLVHVNMKQMQASPIPQRFVEALK